MVKTMVSGEDFPQQTNPVSFMSIDPSKEQPVALLPEIANLLGTGHPVGHGGSKTWLQWEKNGHQNRLEIERT
jgi:hypothetical protein